MTSPLVQDAQTPWTGWTYGRLRNLALESIGLYDPNAVAPNTGLTAASAFEIATMGDGVKMGLCELQEVRERYFGLSEATVTADGDFTSVLLPADFGVAPKDGFKIAGAPVTILSTDDWLSGQRRNSEGGGYLGAPVSGDRVLFGRLVPAKQSAASDVWRWAFFGYPVQTAAWTLTVTYRATAKNLSSDTDALRLPVRLQPLLLRYAKAYYREQASDPDTASKWWRLYYDGLNEIENIPPSEEQDLVLSQGYPKRNRT